MNESVKQVQQILKDRGHDLGKAGPKKDGVDGDAGDRTWKAILAELGGNAVIAPKAPGAGPAPSGFAPSGKCIGLIHSFEQCRLASYPDPGSADGNPWTIGWGSTGSDIKKGLTWTQKQCDDRFARDIGTFSAGVAKAVQGSKTSQNQFDALVSFAYNVGLGALQKSTLLKRHRAGDFTGAAAQFGLWNKNDGKVMKGLVRRRKAEADLYQG